jgi:acyl-CoA reductase-like NAD-dependent aldehyde dehydrogenase
VGDRIDILKTCKLYIDGKFPRSESGRTMEIATKSGPAHLCRASRKDLREAVEAARRAFPGWSGATAYLRGQILYRIAEMLESRRGEFASAIDAVAVGKRAKLSGADAEVTLSIDRLVHFAGWADKYAQVLGCNNPVSGPYYNFTTPEPTGVVAIVCPDERPLLALVSLLAPVICSGNTAVVIASAANSLPSIAFSEACATGDVPPGVINVLTGDRAELVPVIAGHRDIDGVHAANLADADASSLRAGVAENLKRVRVLDVRHWDDAEACEGPWVIEPFVEMKTVWHPASP